MNVKEVSDLQTPIGEILSSASTDGVLIESGGKTPYAILPLDDDLVDHLLEHNPRFLEECETARQRMRSGHFRSHDEVRRLFADDAGPDR